jgi:hypothetical protein
VTYADDGRVALPNDLARRYRETGQHRNPRAKEVAEQLAGVGLDPTTSKAAAALLLQQVGSPVKVEQLGAHQIAMLSVYAGHLNRHQQTRPR